jgi:hypothetical protein
MYQIESNLSKIEAQFTRFFNRQLGLTVELGYNSVYVKDRSEERYSDVDYSSRYGNESTQSNKTYRMLLAMKYYMRSPLNHRVNPYLILGFGKQFTWFENENKPLYSENNSGGTTTVNWEEFINDLNSPYMFNTAFGIEYYINSSISVFSMFRLSHSRSSAEYESKQSGYDNSNHVQNRKVNLSKTNTNVGIGLNFYF